jgi:hypothetical protein
MPSIGIREAGAIVEHTDGGSAIRWFEGGLGDTPSTLLERLIARMRWENDKDRSPARERSLAITNAEQALHWLQALDERKGGQNGR